ncbi:MAG: LysR family transcriptional regulator [Bdellovibrionaceae bacterium]|nr:LysR family transcriptional regulator [Pseudobdellovibrionaceae bacterium]
MNLVHLRYFYDSARLNSMTKAAELHRVGQSAVSKGIQNLEATFRKDLISHQRNRFQLTDNGEVVYSYCEKIFTATDELKDVLFQQLIPAGEVRFACQSSMAESSFLSSVVKTVSEKYPSISLKLMLGRTDIVRDWVQYGVVDFGISLDNVELAGLKAHLLKRGFFYLISGNKDKGSLQHDGILHTESKPEVQALRRMYQARYHERMKSQMVIASWSVIKRFAICGMGVGFVPDYMIQEELMNNLLNLVEPKTLRVPYEIKIVTKEDRYLPKRCQLVISEFISACDLSPKQRS